MQTQQVSEKRTQIYLSEEMHRLVSDKAKEEGVSMASIIRESLVEKFLSKKINKSDSFFGLSGIFESGASDFSSNTPKYLSKLYKDK